MNITKQLRFSMDGIRLLWREKACQIIPVKPVKLPRIRESGLTIYFKMGIIREVAEGMETAAEQPLLSDS